MVCINFSINNLALFLVVMRLLHQVTTDMNIGVASLQVPYTSVFDYMVVHHLLSSTCFPLFHFEKKAIHYQTVNYCSIVTCKNTVYIACTT